MKIKILPRAECEILEASCYYQKKEIGLGERFLDFFDKKINEVL